MYQTVANIQYILVTLGVKLTTKIKVKMFSKLCAIVVFGCAAASAYNTDELMDYEDASDPRLFFTNFTSGNA